MSELSRDEMRSVAWLAMGQREGWIGDLFCEVHDTAVSVDEMENEECVWCVRVLCYSPISEEADQ